MTTYYVNTGSPKEPARSPWERYKRGDVVHIKKVLHYDAARSHFERDADAIVMYSYASKYGRDDAESRNQYSIMFVHDGREVAWYYGEDFEFLRHGGEREIRAVRRNRTKLEKQQTNIDWIIANWDKLRKETPGATMEKLMALVGITEPWGPNGEGYVYHQNAVRTMAILDPIFLTMKPHEIKSTLNINEQD